jgi:hypothetical protein
MERYTITVTPLGAAPIRLLIPFPPTSSISALSAEVKRRVSRPTVWPDVPDLILHLGDASGPILDDDDLLEDVIIDAKVEPITATPRSGSSSAEAALVLPPKSTQVSEQPKSRYSADPSRYPFNKDHQMLKGSSCA